jgi:hypothetical protein
MEIAMNSFVKDELGLLNQTLNLRHYLLDNLTDVDLRYRLPGRNGTFGELFFNIADVQSAYIESFKTLKLDYTRSYNDPAVASSIESLRQRFRELDEELEKLMSEFPEEELLSKIVERGGGFNIPIKVQYLIYREALLIFCAKASIYMKALDKPFNTQWEHWMG